MLCYVMLCYVTLRYVMLCYVMLCYVVLCYVVVLCCVVLCCVVSCYVIILYYIILYYIILYYISTLVRYCHLFLADPNRSLWLSFTIFSSIFGTYKKKRKELFIHKSLSYGWSLVMIFFWGYIEVLWCRMAGLQCHATQKNRNRSINDWIGEAEIWMTIDIDLNLCSD